MTSLAHLCVRHRWWVIAGWIALVVGLTLAATQAGEEHEQSYLFAGTESREAAELIEARFPDAAGERAQLVFTDRGSVRSERYRLEMQAVFEQIAALPHVARVEVPWSDNTGLSFSPDGDTGLARIVFTVDAGRLPTGEIEQLVEITRRWTSGTRQVEVGGAVIDTVLQQGPTGNEVWGVAIAGLVLVVALGTLVAAGLPLVAAAAGLLAGLASIALASHLVSISDFGPQLATLIGLGVGIDYSLLLVSRYRTALERGLEPAAALATTLAGAGRAVLLAGTTVVISLAALALVRVEFVTGLAVASALGVLTSMAAAVTLLPAVLAVLGRRVNALPVRRRSPTGVRWRRWATTVRKRPGAWVAAGLAMLLLLSAPMLSMRLGTVDAGVNSEDSSTRRAHDLVASEFGAGANGPLYVVTDLLPRASQDDLGTLSIILASTPGVASVSPALLDEAGVTSIIRVTPSSGPDTEETADLVSAIRDEVLDPHSLSTGATHHLGGITAAFVDQSSLLGGRLPVVIVVVLAASLVLLTVVFRGVLAALKAVVLNLLSVSAAYGIVVAVFQWGWGLDLIGLDRTGPIIAFAPVFMFAVLFGLSMDYEVFLLSAIREEYDAHGDNARAVAEGLASTGRIITSAAAIMVAVFGSFVFSPDPILKLFGVGLAAAILVDATIVRAVLVPATMQLLGHRNWWLPHWLDRRLPERPAAEPVIDLRDEAVHRPTVVDDPYLVALATGHSTLVNRSIDPMFDAEDKAGWTAEVGDRPTTLTDLFQSIAFVEDDNSRVLDAARDTVDPELLPIIDLAVLFSERHRDLAVDRVDELVLLGTHPPETPGPRTDADSQSLTGRARRTEHLWRVAEGFLDADRIEIVSATAIRWWLRRSSSQWRELGRRGLLQPEAGLLPRGVHRLYHAIAQTEHAGAVALYRFAELDDPDVGRLADRRRELSKLFRDRLLELDDRAPLPPTVDWSETIPAPVVVGADMNDELLDHPLDAALLDWYRREVSDVMAQVRARGLTVRASALDPATLAADSSIDL